MREFKSGIDRHCAIGKGNAFFKHRSLVFDDAELLSYVSLNTSRVVLEFAGDKDFNNIASMIQSLTDRTFTFSKDIFIQCADAIRSI